MMGFDFRVVYKPDRCNIVVDALSRHDEPTDGSLNALSISQLMWLDTLRSEIPSHPDLQSLITKIQSGKALGSWDFKDGLIWYREGLHFCQIQSHLYYYCICA